MSCRLMRERDLDLSIEVVVQGKEEEKMWQNMRHVHIGKHRLTLTQPIEKKDKEIVKKKVNSN